MPDYAPGTPSWVDLSSPDPAASAAFYGQIFGWDATEPNAQAGSYQRFQLGDKSVAGLAPIMQENQPTAWVTYISVADAEETTAKVTAAGGTVAFPPLDVMGMGHMAIYIDPTGAVFGIWQPGTFAGAEIVNEPNSLCWNEVLTRDAEAAQAFYTQVFPWRPERPGFEGAPESYRVWTLEDDKQVGGMMQMNDEFFPPEVPPHWNVCFAVADCDGTVAKARELGAAIVAEAMDMPIGRFASIVDPQGASFSIMQMAPWVRPLSSATRRWESPSSLRIRASRSSAAPPFTTMPRRAARPSPSRIAGRS